MAAPNTPRAGTGFGVLGVAQIEDVTECEQTCTAVRRLIPRVVTTLNGEMSERELLHKIHAKLPTLQATNGGDLRRTERHIQIKVYQPLAGETALLYEMSIPVAETGDRPHVDVQQKVPFNAERDNVTPG